MAARNRTSKQLPASDPAAQLGKRERQIMEIVYRRGRASVSDVLTDLSDPPSYSSVRAMLRYLEDKGHLQHEEEGPRYVYLPTAPKQEVRKSALGHVVRTFFDGSVSSVVAALIESGPLSSEEYERLSRLLDEAAEREAKK
ncbi:MAG TPA: BlaI/MecI/CopY family transcriptional regulator [Sphingomicrobium sp.]